MRAFLSLLLCQTLPVGIVFRWSGSQRQTEFPSHAGAQGYTERSPSSRKTPGWRDDYGSIGSAIQDRSPGRFACRMRGEVENGSVVLEGELLPRAWDSCLRGCEACFVAQDWDLHGV